MVQGGSMQILLSLNYYSIVNISSTMLFMLANFELCTFMLNNTKFNEFNFLNLFQKLGKQIMSKYIEVHQKYKRFIKLP